MAVDTVTALHAKDVAVLVGLPLVQHLDGLVAACGHGNTNPLSAMLDAHDASHSHTTTTLLLFTVAKHRRQESVAHMTRKPCSQIVARCAASG